MQRYLNIPLSIFDIDMAADAAYIFMVYFMASVSGIEPSK